MVYGLALLFGVDRRPNQTSKRWARAVGDAVRSRRRELQLSQEKLAYAAKLDRTYISGIERGVKNPTIQTLRTLSHGLEWQSSELLARAEALELSE